MYFLKSILPLSFIVLLTASFTFERYTGETEEYTVEMAEVAELWETSGLENTEISLKAFYHALSGYNFIKTNYDHYVGDHLVIVDFSLPSDKERFVVYNVESNTVAFTSLVSHGRNSGENVATSFSNQISSYQSSLGFYLTAETYEGKHGYSLRLDGLEDGFNDNARDRAVVMHGAEYATREFIDEHGRLGRSFGCPSLPPEISSSVIDYIKERNILFIYADDGDYLSNSTILNYERLMMATAKSW